MNAELPIWAYFFAPFLVIAGLILAIWQLPTIVFGALTIRRATKIESTFWGLSYAVFLALLCIVSFAWPLLAAYGVSQL